MKDLDNFMTWVYTPELDIQLKISGKGFIENQPVSSFDFMVLIGEWQLHCRHIYCEVDLADANLFDINLIEVCRLISELEEKVEDNGILKSIKFNNSGTVVPIIYKVLSPAIPGSVRNLISIE